jgi:hypothetical protein
MTNDNYVNLASQLQELANELHDGAGPETWRETLADDVEVYATHAKLLEDELAEARATLNDIATATNANKKIADLCKHIDQLFEKVDHKCCGCSVDEPDDVCATHSPVVARLQKENVELKSRIADMEWHMQRLP